MPSDEVLVAANPAGSNLPSVLTCSGMSYPAGVLLNMTWLVDDAPVYSQIVQSPANTSDIPVFQIPNLNTNPEVRHHVLLPTGSEERGVLGCGVFLLQYFPLVKI